MYFFIKSINFGASIQLSCIPHAKTGVAENVVAQSKQSKTKGSTVSYSVFHGKKTGTSERN